MGREDLDCAARVAAIEHEAQAIEGPIVIVAHSAGCVVVAHWALRTRRAVQGALLATPPDFLSPIPESYTTITALRAGGWLPVPRSRPPSSIVAASRNDPLGRFASVAALAPTGCRTRRRRKGRPPEPGVGLWRLATGRRLIARVSVGATAAGAWPA
jgi:pimeloyl-ACP methyl ester carboxylesterase